MNNTADIFSRRRAITIGAVVAGALAASPMVAYADDKTQKINDFLTRVNKDRTAKGYQKLVLDANISKVSQDNSMKMVKANKVINDMGYASDSRVPQGWLDTIQIVAESGYDNGGSIYYQMIESSSAQYLLDRNYNTVGIGLASNSAGVAYITVSLFQYKTKPTTPTQPKQMFQDVHKSTIFREEIEKLASLGVVQGWNMSNGTKQYRPLEDVKRDAMIVFIYRAMGSPKFTAPKKSPFTDVKTNNVFYKEITWAYSKGITEGWKMKDGTRQFRPFESVKRDAVAAFLMRASGEKAPKYKNSFKDVKANQPHANAIVWMKNTGISKGWDNGTYQPMSNTKRDAMAAFIIRWMKHTKRI